MDSLALRKRSGKGIGDGKTKDSGDAAATSSEPSGREVDTGAQGTQVLALEGAAETITGSETMGAESAGPTVNPFWSQRAQNETRLRMMRPDFLGEADVSENQPEPSTPSTELRRPEETATEPTGAVRTTVSEPVRSETPAGGPPGLTIGERQILREMKQILENVVQQNLELTSQNEALRQRLDKLEDDKVGSQDTWRSAASGGMPEGIEATVGLGVEGEQVQGWGEGDLGRFVPPNPTSSEPLKPLTDPMPKPGAVEISSVEYQRAFEHGYNAATEALEIERNWELAMSPPSVRDLQGCSGFESVERDARERSPEPSPLSAERTHRLNTTPQKPQFL